MILYDYDYDYDLTRNEFINILNWLTIIPVYFGNFYNPST